MGYREMILRDVPAAYYQLGESSGTTAADASGNGHDGSYSGGYTLGQAGAVASSTDTAVLLDGASGYVALGTAPAAFASVTPTVEIWQRLGGSGDRGSVSVGQGGRDGYGAAVAGNGHHALVKFGVVGIDSGVAAAVGAWEHVVWTVATDNRARLYVNGALVYTDSNTTPILPATGSVGLGCQFDSGTGAPLNFFSGELDEVALYGTALSAAQVLAHYAEGLASAGLKRPWAG